jgi:predicted DNA-binding transcriptional regulator YafY
MADRPTLIRQWLLIRALCASRSGWSIRDLAAEFSVSEKSIRRDLDALTLAGFRLSETVEDRGRKRWRLDGSQSVPLPELNLSEAAALYLGRRLLEPLAGTTLWESAQSAFVKLRQQFCPDTLAWLESLAVTLHETTFGQSDYSERAEVIDTLMAGVSESRVTRLLYHPLRSDVPEEYELQPLGIIWHRSTLYLVAASVEHPRPRHFKVDRIRDVEVLTTTFARPPNFDLQQHLQHSLGVYQTNAPVTKVRIWFSADAARYVTEHRWHDSQQIQEQADGTLLVDLTLSDLTELTSWVLSFGSRAVVLAPESLQKAIQRELGASLAAYTQRISASIGEPDNDGSSE